MSVIFRHSTAPGVNRVRNPPQNNKCHLGPGVVLWWTTGLICFHSYLRAFVLFWKPPFSPRHPRLCEPRVVREVSTALPAYSLFIGSSLSSFAPTPSNRLHPSLHPSPDLVDKAILLIEDWAAFSDPGRGGEAVRGFNEKMLCQTPPLPNLHQVQKILFSDLVSGIKMGP